MFLKKLTSNLGKYGQKILENYEINPKDLFIKIRMLLTGKKFGPSMNELLTLFTKNEILKRIEINSEK